MSEEPTDVHQCDVEQVDHGAIPEDEKDPVKLVEPERISVQELINRMGVQANKFGAASRTRLVLINAARALVELTTRLDAAEREIERRNDEEKPRIITLPGGAV